MSNLILKKGDTLRRVLSLIYDQTGAVVDLTGCTAYSQLRENTDGEVLAEGATSVTASAGQVTVTYSAAQTAELEPGEYGYDVRLVNGEDVKTIWTERITIFDPYTEIGG